MPPGASTLWDGRPKAYSRRAAFFDVLPVFPSNPVHLPPRFLPIRFDLLSSPPLPRAPQENPANPRSVLFIPVRDSAADVELVATRTSA